MKNTYETDEYIIELDSVNVVTIFPVFKINDTSLRKSETYYVDENEVQSNLTIPLIRKSKGAYGFSYAAKIR
jgi:hypothetical protein